MSNVVFNFQQRFADAVASGKKHQTLRALRKDGRLPNVGDTVKCYTGMRSKGCRLLRVGEVAYVATVSFAFNIKMLLINGQHTSTSTCTSFAKADGFNSFDEMLRWFHDQYGGDVFHGYVTVWKS